MLQLRDKYEVKNFIETGTYFGNTAAWAAAHFDNVITVEYSQEIYEETVAKCGNIQNINFMFGDSRSALRAIIPALTRPAIFWIDSHWSGGQTYGENDECPLIEEINEINKSIHDHFLFIDDARLFTSPPPQPHRAEGWPSIDKVIEALKSSTHNYYIVLIEDVIIAVPTYAKEFIVKYCQEVNTKAWEEYGKRFRFFNEASIRHGLSSISHGLRLIAGGLGIQLKGLVSHLTTRVISR